MNDLVRDGKASLAGLQVNSGGFRNSMPTGMESLLARLELEMRILVIRQFRRGSSATTGASVKSVA